MNASTTPTTPATTIIAAGSPSTLLAIAGYCRANGISAEDIREGEVSVVLTQAFQVGNDPRTGHPGPALIAVQALRVEDRVVLIGLPVNNRDPNMTIEFVCAIGTNRLVGIYDEHEPERWAALRDELGLSAGVFHTPGKGEGHLSAASIIGSEFPAMPAPWVEAGDWADNRGIEASDEAKALATNLDGAVKARIADNAFRVVAIRHLIGGDPEADRAFKERLAEGKAIAAATAAALAAAEQRGNVLVVSQPPGAEINQTAAMFGGYRRAPFVAVTGQKAGEGEVIVVGYDSKKPLGEINLLEVFKAVGLVASGIPDKATVHGTENLDRIVETLNTLA